MKTERCKENGKIYQKLCMKPTQKRQSCICDCQRFQLFMQPFQALHYARLAPRLPFVRLTFFIDENILCLGKTCNLNVSHFSPLLVLWTSSPPFPVTSRVTPLVKQSSVTSWGNFAVSKFFLIIRKMMLSQCVDRPSSITFVKKSNRQSSCRCLPCCDFCYHLSYHF